MDHELLGKRFVSSLSPIPAEAARHSPCTFPVGVVSVELKSPWASTYKTPTFFSDFFAVAASPASEPSTIEWSPPRTKGNSSLAVISSTLSASFVQAFIIGCRYFAFGFPMSSYSCALG